MAGAKAGAAAASAAAYAAYGYNVSKGWSVRQHVLILNAVLNLKTVPLTEQMLVCLCNF